MSHTVTETDDFPVAIVAPDVLDTNYPTTVPAGITDLASRTNWLRNTLNGQTGSTDTLNTTNTGVFDAGNYTVPTTTRGNVVYQLAYQIVSTIRFVRQHVWGGTESTAFLNVPVDPVVESDGGATQVTPGTYWSPGAASDVISWSQASVAGAVRMWWFVYGLPPSGKINTIGCLLDGAAGHGGVMPTTKPKLSLYRQVFGQAPALVDSITDPTVSAATYEAEHTVIKADLNETIPQNCRYFFRLEGETGGSAVTGLKITSSYLGVTHA